MNASSNAGCGVEGRTAEMDYTQRYDVPVGDEIRCAGCGRIIRRPAAACLHCRTRTSGDPIACRLPVPCNRKRKRTAILLALSLGYWAWTYTVAVDWWRFLVSLIVQVLLMGLLIALGVTVGLDDGDAAGFVAFAVLIQIAVCWLWPIIHTGLRRPQFYYHDYPQAE